jgi:hypothetical protein
MTPTRCTLQQCTPDMQQQQRRLLHARGDTLTLHHCRGWQPEELDEMHARRVLKPEESTVAAYKTYITALEVRACARQQT